MAAHQAPLSLGFSRQEHWSGLPFPFPMHESESEVAQSCPTLSNPMDCSPPGSSVHVIFQARVLEWGAIALSFRRAGHILIRMLVSWFKFYIFSLNLSCEFVSCIQLPTQGTGIFPHSSLGKESSCKSGDLGSVPGLQRSSGEGKGNPLQYSCL